MRFSDVKGRKVISTATAVTAGKIDDVIIDTPTARIVALVLKKTAGDADTVPWQYLSAFGSDAVTVADEQALLIPDEQLKALGDKRFALHGKRVLAQTGEDLGEVKDVDFDAQTGAIRLLLLKKHGEIDGSRLVATGSYAVIVKAAPAQ